MIMPACSVLMPFRNAASTVADSLRSILAQTYSNFELLAIDDCSSDGSAAIVAGHARNDPRIRLLCSPGSGLVAALNAGLQWSRCEHIARMDADDLMRPQRLERQLDFLQRHPDTALVAGRVRKFPRDALRAGYLAYEQWQNELLSPQAMADDRYVESPVAHPAVMFRKSAVLECGAYHDGAFPEDYELWLRMLQVGHRFAKIDAVLLDWRESEYRTSRTDSRYSRAAFDRLRADYLARDPRVVGADRVVVWGAGLKSRQRVRLLVDRGIRLHRWIDIDPRKVGRQLWERPIQGPESLQQGPSAGDLLLCYVTNHGARGEIAAFLDPLGYQRGRDYLFVG